MGFVFFLSQGHDIKSLHKGSLKRSQVGEGVDIKNDVGRLDRADDVLHHLGSCGSQWWAATRGLW